MKIWPKEVEALIVRRRPPNGAQWLDPNWYELLRVVDPQGNTSLLLYERARYRSPKEALRRKRIAHTDWAPLNSAPMYLHEGTFYFWKPPYQRDLLDDIDEGMTEAAAILGPIGFRMILAFAAAVWLMDAGLEDALPEEGFAVLTILVLIWIGWPRRRWF